MLVLEGSANLCVLVNLESAVCACSSDLPLPAEEDEGTWLSVFMCMRILYVGAAEGSVLSVASRASVRVPVCVSGMRTQLRYWFNLQMGKCQPHPSARAEALGPWAGLQ